MEELKPSLRTMEWMLWGFSLEVLRMKGKVK